MILCSSKIGINVFKIEDNKPSKYYYLESKIIDGDIPMGSISVKSKDINFNNSVSGTQEEIEEMLKYFVWDIIKDFDVMKKPFKIIDLPNSFNLNESIDLFHKNVWNVYYEIRNKFYRNNATQKTTTNISIHQECMEYLCNLWGFNLKEKLDTIVTINNNLPLNKIIFTNVSSGVTYGDISVVYKNILNDDKTYTIFFDIVVMSKENILSVNIPIRAFRKNIIDGLL